MKKISYIDNFEQWAAEFDFFIPIKVRFSETDMFGHLNNTVPFIYWFFVKCWGLMATALSLGGH